MKLKSLYFLQLISFFIIGAGFYLPILVFLSGSNPLFPEESFLNWSFFLDFLKDSWNLKVIGFSILQAFLSALFSIIFGLPGAWLVTYYDFPGKRWFNLLTYLPFILPSILVVLAMVLFFGNNGWINRGLMYLFSFEEQPIQFLYSLSGILVAHVFYNFPIAMKIISDQWERISFKYLQAARSLGVGSIKLFFCITLPLLMPSLGSAFLLIFLLCMNSFAIILVLGGGIHFTTIEVLIYQLARLELDYSGASSLAFLQSVFSLVCITILIFGIRQNTEQNFTNKYSLTNGMMNFCPKAWFGFFWICVVLIFSIGPLLTIILDSFRRFENGEWIYTIYWYEKLLDRGENNFFLFALWNSFRIGLGSAILSSFVGLGLVSLIVYKKGINRRFWEAFSLFPMILSTIVFGVAWFHFFQSYLVGIIPLIYIVIVMHTILTCPYWIRVVIPSLETIPFQWHIEAKMLGNKSFQYGLKILWPWLRRTFIIAFFFSFSLSLGELNSTMMIADESIRTLPLEIYDAISGYRFSYASAVAVILLSLSIFTFIFIEFAFGYFKLFSKMD